MFKNEMTSLTQTGIALPLVLILLLVMTLLGIVTLNTTVVEDQMAANSRQRQIAFNAAETTLRFGELHAAELRTNIRGGDLIASDGTTVNLFDSDSSNPRWPDASLLTHSGNTCDGGYCIPAQYHQSTTVATYDERWEDSTLDVWNDSSKHHEFDDYTSSNMQSEGIFEAPKYIIEYVGNFYVSNASGEPDVEPSCDPFDSSYISDSARWPYCIVAPSLFRITSRVVAGAPGSESVVILQSTIRVPD